MIGDIFHFRRWWTADVSRGVDGVWLHVRRGARHVTIWRSSLETFDERIEPAERLEAEAGDAFVCVGPAIDEMMLATVERVNGERLLVTLGSDLAQGTRVVQLLGMHGLKQAKKRKAA